MAYTSTCFESPPDNTAEHPPTAVGLFTTTGGAIRGSAAPPLRLMRAGYTERSSVTSTVMDLPSALKRGADTPRSRAAAAFTRVGALEPSAGTTANRSML